MSPRPFTPSEPLDGARDRLRESRGFTLIEILVVLAIVLFLAAFLLPHLGTISRNKTYNTVTESTIKQCELALQGYRSEFGVYPPDLKTLLSPTSRTIECGTPGDPRSQRVLTFPPFLILAKEHISADGNEILDAWGSPLHYDPTRSKGLVWSDNT